MQQGGHDLRPRPARHPASGSGRGDGGEIRDLETAQIAVQASLTGHLVMSTLHQHRHRRHRPDEDMGIEPFLLSSSLLAVLAQRLVRTLCLDCRTAHPITEQERWPGLDLPPDQQIWRPVGCRVQPHRLSRPDRHPRAGGGDEAVREAIHGANGEARHRAADPGPYPSIRRDGIDKVLQGQTSLEEVLRVTRED